MFEAEIEVRSRLSGRAFIIPSWFVTRLGSSSFDPVRIRSGADEHVVLGHLVRAISRTDALSIARDALDVGSWYGYGLRRIIQDLGSNTDREAVLVNVLMREYVLVQVEGDRGQWNGPAAKHQREELPEPARRTTPRPQLTWVAITVLDADEPDRKFAGAQFRLRLPDGSTQADALDGEGHVRVDDIQAGKCWLEITDIAREPA